MNKKKRTVRQLRNSCGEFTDRITVREFIRRLTVATQWCVALSFLGFFTFLLVRPIEMVNPLIGIETVKTVEAKSNSNSLKAEDELDRRIEDCWAKGWQPGILDTGFVCASPAVDLPTK